ncbi:MAG: type II toxin-antitoxin system RelE/ParE family toxin [Chitinophagaceae bacterium]|nr:type II toxin-antitoxin system RelE/ParE family toxin [Chitinophagaceae bacterium]
MDKKQKFRTVITYKDYFENFFVKQRQKVRDKIIWTFDLIEEVERIPETYLKHIDGADGLFEIRVQSASDIFRIFCFFDEGRLIVLANGFQKKTQKTPKKEIEKALKIRKEYETELRSNHDYKQKNKN